jgi:hypothetical protein
MWGIKNYREHMGEHRMLKRIIEEYPEETFLKADGFGDAILGVEEYSMRLIYSVKECIKILSKSISREEALEYFDYNVQGSYLGEKTPIWCNDNI